MLSIYIYDNFKKTEMRFERKVLSNRLHISWNFQDVLGIQYRYSLLTTIAFNSINEGNELEMQCRLIRFGLPS